MYQTRTRSVPLLTLPLLFGALAVTAPARAQSLGGAKLQYQGNTGGDDLIIRGVFHPKGRRAVPSIANPIIEGVNLYAPDLVRNGGAWNLYYGGWETTSDVNDRIYFAVSDDLLPEGAWSGQFPVIDHGEYLHVNDPSVQKRRAGDWVMAYTVAAFDESGDFRDWIAVSTSPDGASWTPDRGTRSAEIGITNASFFSIARPSLLWTGDRWRLWFDGKMSPDDSIHSYVAESQQSIPRDFQLLHRYDDVAGFPGFFEPDVELVDGRFMAVIQHGFRELRLMESQDGIEFRTVGTMLRSRDSDPNSTVGRDKVSNPGLIYDAGNDLIWGAAFGMTDSPTLVGHDVGFAYTQYQVRAVSCPDTVHGIDVAHHLDEVRVRLFGFQEVCLVRVTDPATGQSIEREVDAAPGDRYLLRLANEGFQKSISDLEDDLPDEVTINGGCAAAGSRVGGGIPLALVLGGLLLAHIRRRQRDDC